MASAAEAYNDSAATVPLGPALRSAEVFVEPAQVLELGIIDAVSPETSSRQRWANRGRAAVVSFCVGPGNELSRYAAFGAAEAAGAPPVVSALAFSASSLAIEGVTARFGARLLSRPLGDKAVNIIRKGASKIGMDEGVTLSRPWKVAAGLLGGSFVSEVVEKVENPDISEDELRNKGYFSAKAITGVMALQGYAMAKGIDVVSIPHAIAGAGVLFGTIGAGLKAIKKHVQHEQAIQSAPELIGVIQEAQQ